MLRSSVVQRCSLACFTAARTADLDMKLEAYDATGGGTFCRSAARVTRSGRSDSEADGVAGSEVEPAAEAEPAVAADRSAAADTGLSFEAAGPVATTPTVTAAAVARTARGPMTASGLGLLRRASGSRLWRWSATALIPLQVGYKDTRRAGRPALGATRL